MTQEGMMGEWISVEKQLPDPVHSWGSNPPSISEDVLCIWEGGEYGIANYDCEETEWCEKTGADSYEVADYCRHPLDAVAIPA